MKLRPSTPRRHPALAFLAAALLCGCEGGGEGQVSGSLFLRGCPEQGSAAAPAPFALDPSYFAADTIRSATAGQSGSQLDERIPNRMELRLQRSSHRPELTDAFALYLRRSAGLVQTLLVLGMVAVAHVETGYVQTRCDQLFHPLLGRRRRPERTHDLCSTHGTTLAEIASATRKQQ